MAVRYPKSDQKKFLDRVKSMLGEGHTLNSACSSVSSREGGLPTTNTLAKWAKAAKLYAANAEAAPEPEKHESPAISAGQDQPSHEVTGNPASAIDEGMAGCLGPAIAPDAEPVSTLDTVDDTGPAADVDEHPVELVRVSAGGFREAVEENQRLRRALEEADREIRAMRDLLVVYASR